MSNQWCSQRQGCLCARDGCPSGAGKSRQRVPVGKSRPPSEGDDAYSQLVAHQESIAATYKPDGISAAAGVLISALLVVAFFVGIVVGLGLA